MGLAPAERLALARIGNDLRRSDPVLAARLRAFGGKRGRPHVPACERRTWWPRARILYLLAVSAALLAGVLWGIALSGSAGSQARSPGCGYGWHVHPCAAGPGPAGDHAEHRQPQPGIR